MKRSVVAVLLALASTSAFADGQSQGHLNWAFQSLQSFYDVTVDDVGNGKIEGNASELSGSYPIEVYVKGNELHMPWGVRNDFLTFTPQGSKKTYYRGSLWEPSPSTITVLLTKNGYNIEGTIGKKTTFSMNVDSKKKYLYASWDNLQFTLENDKKEPGGCKGTFGQVTDPSPMKVVCHSSGTLLDALFKNPQDTIALLIYHVITPNDNLAQSQD